MSCDLKGHGKSTFLQEAFFKHLPAYLNNKHLNINVFK